MSGRRRLLTALGAAIWFLLASLPASAVEEPADEQETYDTVVSFTFDGTFKGQDDAARILAENGLAGTFYINSGYIDYPAYLALDEVRDIARQRNEIGGASLVGNDLSKLTVAEATNQVCDDRATLAQLGFQVTSFAYPHGAGTPQVKSVVQKCGYNNSRDLAGLYEGPGNCDSCPRGEPMPPVDDYRIRTNTVDVSLEGLKRHVEAAEQDGGGWVPLVFTHVCICPTEEQAISPADFRAFAEWIKERPATTQVKTMDQVMGGELQPATGTPLERLVPSPSSGISTDPGALSKLPAWTVLGVGIGQAQIIALGICVTIAIVITYRLATRGNRYGRV